MSTVIAIVVAICALGMLIAYYLGFSAGKREGFNSGRDKGKKEGTAKAFAVGYDRGKHDREVTKEEQPPTKRGCFMFVILFAALVGSLVVALI